MGDDNIFKAKTTESHTEYRLGIYCVESAGFGLARHVKEDFKA
jgi:hypothetical protein